MVSLRHDAQRIDDGRQEKSRLDDDLPHLIQVPIPEEEHARAERQADHNDQKHAEVENEESEGERGRSAIDDRAKQHDDYDENSERDDRVRRDATTTIQDGNRAFVSRYPFA